MRLRCGQEGGKKNKRRPWGAPLGALGLDQARAVARPVVQDQDAGPTQGGQEARLDGLDELAGSEPPRPAQVGKLAVAAPEATHVPAARVGLCRDGERGAGWLPTTPERGLQAKAALVAVEEVQAARSFERAPLAQSLSCRRDPVRRGRLASAPTRAPPAPTRPAQDLF